MANKERAEVSLRAGQQTFTLRFNSNALAELESALDMQLPDIAREMGARRVGIRTIRALVWAGLLKHHPGITLEMAGDIMDEVGLEECGPAAIAAFSAAFPQGPGRGQPAKNGKQGADGTGAAS